MGLNNRTTPRIAADGRTLCAHKSCNMTPLPGKIACPHHERTPRISAYKSDRRPDWGRK